MSICDTCARADCKLRGGLLECGNYIDARLVKLHDDLIEVLALYPDVVELIKRSVDDGER